MSKSRGGASSQIPAPVQALQELQRLVRRPPSSEERPWDHPQGPGSSLAKLMEPTGQVLMLGAALDTLTLLHHAEALVDALGKRVVSYAIPVREGDRVEWREAHDHDTSSRGAFPYDMVIPVGEDAFTVIGRLALAAGAGISGKAGDAECYLFQARPLVDFATSWLQNDFGGTPSLG